MVYHANIVLPICPVCGVVLLSLSSTGAGETAEFGCGARAFRSFCVDNQSFEWTKSCKSLLEHMAAPKTPTLTGD